MKKSFLLLFLLHSVQTYCFVEQDSIVSVSDTMPAVVQNSTTAALSISDSAKVFSLSPHLIDYKDQYPVTGNVKMKQCYYNAKRDLSFASAPYIVMGLGMKPFKRDIRHANLTINEGFKHRWDDYVQFSPLALTYILKAAQVENRSKWGRLMASNAFSAATMAALVNIAKYSFKEMRPDGSTKNSFPSGHTATAFMCATILHKEYGLTRSPLYSVAGYATATAIGTMRVLNNRHWVSDVMVGAGIGILSTELGYFFGDMVFKNKHIIRKEKDDIVDIRKHPSFFNLTMGPCLKMNNIPVPDAIIAAGGPTKIKTGFAVSAGAEAAYFFNPYIGLGGRIRVTSTPVRPEQKITDSDVWTYGEITWNPTPTSEYPGGHFEHPVTTSPTYSSSKGYSTDQMSTFDYMGGVYAQLPVKKRWAFGAKLLFGGCTNGYSWYSADISGNYDNADSYLASRMGNLINDDGKFNENYKDYDKVKYLEIDGHHAFTMGAGLSVTYAYKHHMLWKLGVDWDMIRNRYSFSYMDYSDEHSNTGFLNEAVKRYNAQYGTFTRDNSQVENFQKAYESVMDDTNYDAAEIKGDIRKTLHNMRVNLGVAYCF